MMLSCEVMISAKESVKGRESLPLARKNVIAAFGRNSHYRECIAKSVITAINVSATARHWWTLKSSLLALRCSGTVAWPAKHERRRHSTVHWPPSLLGGVTEPCSHKWPWVERKTELQVCARWWMTFGHTHRPQCQTLFVLTDRRRSV